MSISPVGEPVKPAELQEAQQSTSFKTKAGATLKDLIQDQNPTNSDEKLNLNHFFKCFQL